MSTKQTNKTPTVYSLFLKYILSDEDFRKQYSSESNKNIMKKAIQLWNEINDSKKTEWKQIVSQMTNIDIDLLLHKLFNDYKPSNTVINDTNCGNELIKDEFLILTKEQMPNYVKEMVKPLKKGRGRKSTLSYM